VVKVRDGYARNFLLPQGKALRANEANRKRFDSERSQLEARNLERKQEADAVAAKLSGQTFVVIRQAGETGHLYGSVSSRDIVEAMIAGGFTVARNQVALNQPIKAIGLHPVKVVLHPEVMADITVNVARSDDEAVRQAQGEDLTRLAAEAGEEQAPEPAGEEGEQPAAEAAGEEAKKDEKRG
jgi:large subunit ribosomal protein L9